MVSGEVTSGVTFSSKSIRLLSPVAVTLCSNPAVPLGVTPTSSPVSSAHSQAVTTAAETQLRPPRVVSWCRQVVGLNQVVHGCVDASFSLPVADPTLELGLALRTREPSEEEGCRDSGGAGTPASTTGASRQTDGSGGSQQGNEESLVTGFRVNSSFCVN